MPTYTVEFEIINTQDPRIWQAVAPAETVTDDGSPQQVARWAAANQTLVEGTGWRVRVWLGEGVNTGDEPAAEHYADEATATLGLAQRYSHDGDIVFPPE